MAITSWPYVAQDTTDVEYSRLFREMVGDGVVGGVGDTALRVTADSSGMLVKMASGAAIARGYMMYSTAQEIIPVGASHPSLRRLDRCILELNLSAPSIPQRLTPKILPGVAGAASPTALTQTDTGVYQIGMSIITVEAGVNSIASDKVADDRDWLDQRVGVWVNNGKRPVNPRKFKLGFNQALGFFEYYDGSDWVDLRAHTHSLSSNQITGTLPVGKGGTGATTKGGIRNTIGITVSATAPADPQPDDLWVKKSS